MSRHRRRTLDPGEEAIAVAAGFVAGLAVGYLTRLWLGRSRLDVALGAGASPRADRGPLFEEPVEPAPEPTGREGEPGR